VTSGATIGNLCGARKPIRCGLGGLPLLSGFLVILWLATGSAAAAIEPAAAESATAEPATAQSYRLNAGDQVSIQVFGEPELSVQVRIADNGRLTYPFLGDIPVGGVTSADLEKTISDGLRGDFLIDPKVSVTITEYRPFFVNGQVKSPGSFPYQPQLTVRKAISLAGGLTERGSERRISLIAEGDKGKSGHKGKSVHLDDAVGPGDILTVDESFF
jgi:polysaccharide export outer membrane protein